MRLYAQPKKENGKNASVSFSLATTDFVMPWTRPGHLVKDQCRTGEFTSYYTCRRRGSFRPYNVLSLFAAGHPTSVE